MKIEGARPGPIANVRRRAGTGVVTAGAARPLDTVSVLGFSHEDLTQPVRAALETLSLEIEALRQEVTDLTARLQEAEVLADQDVLADVYNRRAFVRELQRGIALAQRHDTPASVAFFDLDGFKAVNDRWGHAAGDEALRAVARRLRQNVREEDIVARLGGDEFAVLLLHADRMDAAIKAQQLKAAIEAEPVVVEGAAFTLSITYGVRQLGGADDAEQALSEADAAMYLRKPGRP